MCLQSVLSFDRSGHCRTSFSNRIHTPNSNQTNEIKMKSTQVFFTVLVAAVYLVSAICAAEQPKQSSAAPAAGDGRNKRGLYASPYFSSPYAASPYVASPYVASPYVASPYVASPYSASPYVASPYSVSPYHSSYYPYGAYSSYATYPYVSKTFSSPYAYYP